MGPTGLKMKDETKKNRLIGRLLICSAAYQKCPPEVSPKISYPAPLF